MHTERRGVFCSKRCVWLSEEVCLSDVACLVCAVKNWSCMCT